MNQYLEKVASLLKEALNAQKARQMAEQVGVIPDPESAWKYALRNLRDGRGDPLQGRALSEKRIELGDVSNNAFQKIRSVDRKLGKTTTGEKGITTGTEFTGDVDTKGNVGELRKGVLGQVPGEILGNMHTHPSEYSKTNAILADRISAGLGRTGNPHRIAKPSGDYSNPLNFHSEYLIDAEGSRQVLDTRIKAYESSKNALLKSKSDLDFMKNALGSSHPDVVSGNEKFNRQAHALSDLGNALSDKVRDVTTDLIDKHPNLTHQQHTYPQADHSIFSKKTGINRVVAPKVGTVTANKIGKTGLRTTYFHHD